MINVTKGRFPRELASRRDAVEKFMTKPNIAKTPQNCIESNERTSHIR